MSESIKDLWSSAQNKLAEVYEALTSKRSDISSKESELKAAQRSHRQLDEMEPIIRRHVDKTGAAFVKNFSSRIVAGEHGFGRHDVMVGQWLPWSGSDGVPWGLVCATEPDRAFAMINALILMAPSYRPGPSAGERAGIIETLQGELAALKAEEEAMVDEMLTAGMAVQHRPEVVTKRAEEARAQELREAFEAQAIERQARIDSRQPDSSGRTAYSRYINPDQPEQQREL